MATTCGFTPPGRTQCERVAKFIFRETFPLDAPMHYACSSHVAVMLRKIKCWDSPIDLKVWCRK